ncbi:hypothetical protein IAU60_001257 [Kwoniella sp. DSM 27419]
MDTSMEAGPSRPSPSRMASPLPTSMSNDVIMQDVSVPLSSSIPAKEPISTKTGEPDEAVQLLLNISAAADIPPVLPPEPEALVAIMEKERLMEKSEPPLATQTYPYTPPEDTHDHQEQPLVLPSVAKSYLEGASAAASETTKPKQKRKRNNASSRRASAEHPQHWLGEDNTIIRCICGFTEDDGFTIQCEGCGAWEHGICFGYVDESTAPDTFFCELCQPRPFDASAARRMQVAVQEQNRKLRSKVEGEKDGLAEGKPRSKGGKAKRPRTESVQEENADARDTGKENSPGAMGPPATKPRRRQQGGKPRGKQTTTESSTPGPSSYRDRPILEEPEDDYFRIEPWTLEYTPIKDNIVRGLPARQIMRKVYKEWVEVEDEIIANRSRTVHNPSGLPSPTETGVLRLSPDNLFPQPDFSTLAPPVPPVFLFGPDLESLGSAVSVQIVEDAPSFLPLNYAENISKHGVYTRPTIFSVHADEFISFGSFVGEYRGEVTDCETYRRDPINQYASLGMPKPHVRSIGPPVNLIIDARGYGNDLRFVRSGCHPNVVLRPLLWRTAEDEPPKLKFGLFASKDIAAKEELVMGWEWDDQHVVHSLRSVVHAAMLSDGSLASPVYALSSKKAVALADKIDSVLTHIYGTFTACACVVPGTCALAQMGQIVDPKAMQDTHENGKKKLRVDLGELVGAVRGWRRREVELAEAKNWRTVEALGLSRMTSSSSDSRSDDLPRDVPSSDRPAEGSPVADEDVSMETEEQVEIDVPANQPEFRNKLEAGSTGESFVPALESELEPENEPETEPQPHVEADIETALEPEPPTAPTSLAPTFEQEEMQSSSESHPTPQPLMPVPEDEAECDVPEVAFDGDEEMEEEEEEVEETETVENIPEDLEVKDETFKPVPSLPSTAPLSKSATFRPITHEGEVFLGSPASSENKFGDDQDIPDATFDLSSRQRSITPTPTKSKEKAKSQGKSDRQGSSSSLSSAMSSIKASALDDAELGHGSGSESDATTATIPKSDFSEGSYLTMDTTDEEDAIGAAIDKNPAFRIQRKEERQLRREQHRAQRRIASPVVASAGAHSAQRPSMSDDEDGDVIVHRPKKTKGQVNGKASSGIGGSAKKVKKSKDGRIGDGDKAAGRRARAKRIVSSSASEDEDNINVVRRRGKQAVSSPKSGKSVKLEALDAANSGPLDESASAMSFVSVNGDGTEAEPAEPRINGHEDQAVQRPDTPPRDPTPPPKEPSPPPPEPPKKVSLSDYLKSHKIRKESQTPINENAPVITPATEVAPTPATPTVVVGSIPSIDDIPGFGNVSSQAGSAPIPIVTRATNSSPVKDEAVTPTSAPKLNLYEHLPSARLSVSAGSSEPSRPSVAPAYVPRSVSAGSAEYFPSQPSPSSSAFVPRVSTSYTPRQATVSVEDGHPSTTSPGSNAYPSRPAPGSSEEGLGFAPGGYQSRSSPRNPPLEMPPPLPVREPPPHAGQAPVAPTPGLGTRLPPTGPKVPPTGPRGLGLGPGPAAGPGPGPRMGSESRGGFGGGGPGGGRGFGGRGMWRGRGFRGGWRGS